MSNRPINSYRIVRRAFGQYIEIDVISTDWVSAELICMMMEAYNRDGEYMLRTMDEPDHRQVSPSICPVQAAFAYL
jgi:hypothetical protein